MGSEFRQRAAIGDKFRLIEIVTTSHSGLYLIPILSKSLGADKNLQIYPNNVPHFVQ